MFLSWLPAWALLVVLLAVVAMNAASMSSTVTEGMVVGRKLCPGAPGCGWTEFCKQNPRAPGCESSDPALPAWATGPQTWHPLAVSNHALNKDDAKSSKRFDVVVFGDSITADLRALRKTPWSKTAFDPFFQGLNVGTFGAPGNVVEDLVWRLMVGGERPKLDPKVAVLWIGTNNIKRGQSPVDKLDFLFGWMRRVMPKTKLVYLAILPRGQYDTRPTNKLIEPVCRKHGVTFAECGQAMDPADTKLFKDGLHLNPGGYEVVMRCLGGVVRKLL